MSRRRNHAITGVAWILRPLFDLAMSRRWEGAENLPSDGGFIVCPNHSTEIDPIVVGHMLYNNGCPPHFMAKASLFRVPVLGAVLTAAKQIPVERSTAGANRSLDVCRSVLDDGGAVVVYPEGTLTRDPDLWPMKGRTGAARLALQTGAPVIPIAHWGANDLLPRYAKRPRLLPRPRVRVLAGPAVDLSEFKDRPLTRTTLEAATEKIMDAITGLEARLRNATPPAERWDPARHRQSITGRNLHAGTELAGPEVPAPAAPAEAPARGDFNGSTEDAK